MERLLSHDDIRIVILTPAFDDKNFINEFSYSDRIFIEGMQEVDRDYDLLDKAIWKFWLLGQRFRIFQSLYKTALKTQLRRRYYNKFHSFYGMIFDKYSPDLVIGGTPGMNSRKDLPVFAEAQERGIKTIALIHSWDNISKRKGPLWVRPDILGVWNQFQREEAVKTHFYKDENVRLLGASHFDIYWKEDTFMGREDFFRKMGIDQDKKLISVIVTAQNLVKSTFIIDILLDAFRKNKFILPVQLLCRPLPRADQRINDELFGKYYGSPDIIIDKEAQLSPKIGWNPNRDQLYHFANLVKYTDVQVSIISTATIEAAILDRPVVNVGFSTIEPELFQRLIIDSVYENHFKPILDYGASYVAKDSEDLVTAINKYLLDPSLHKKERERLKKDIIYKPDGKATERVSRAILELVN